LLPLPLPLPLLPVPPLPPDPPFPLDTLPLCRPSIPWMGNITTYSNEYTFTTTTTTTRKYIQQIDGRLISQIQLKKKRKNPLRNSKL
jgi:hypothetical protein